MKDPPQGRIGYVIDGLGRGRSHSWAPLLTCCRGCSLWFDKKLGGCPDCGRELPGFCKAIRTAQLNNQLYVQAGLRNP